MKQLLKIILIKIIDGFWISFVVLVILKITKLLPIIEWWAILAPLFFIVILLLIGILSFGSEKQKRYDHKISVKDNESMQEIVKFINLLEKIIEEEEHNKQ